MRTDNHGKAHDQLSLFKLTCNVQFLKKIHPYSMEGISRGMGLLEANILEAKYEAKLEFLGGWRAKQKPSVGEVWIFPGTVQCHCHTIVKTEWEAMIPQHIFHDYES